MVFSSTLYVLRLFRQIIITIYPIKVNKKLIKKDRLVMISSGGRFSQHLLEGVNRSHQ